MTKKIGIGLVVIAIIAIGGYVFIKGAPEVPNLGAIPGNDVTETIYFRGGFAEGSSCFATSTTGTLTAGMLRQNSCIRIAATGAGQETLSLTLPASTTAQSLLPATGACRSWWVDADAVAAATTTTFVAGTGVVLVGLDATGAGTGADVIDGDEYGRLTMCKKSDGDVAAYIQEYIHAD